MHLLDRSFFESEQVVFLRGCRKSLFQPSRRYQNIRSSMRHVFNVHPRETRFFTAIVAPTGTGKTQLAATASLEKDNVRYLLCEGSLTDLVQPFYKPHNELTNFLLKALTHFRVHFSDRLKRFKGANAYVQWFSEEEVSSPLVTLIHRILFPESPNLEDGLSFGALRKIILERQSKFLVFLDEIPPSRQPYHAEIVLFRDLLRGVGICPTLMSTHSGAQNAVTAGPASSNTDEKTKWCDLITRSTHRSLLRKCPHICVRPFGGSIQNGE